MPRNENLPKVEHKSKNILKTTNKEPEFKCLEAFLKVKLMPGSYPSWEQLKEFIPYFVDATWGLRENIDDEEADEIVCKMFKGEHLPGAMETFNFTFLVSGMTYVEVSHFLRHREVTFSSVCTGDRYLGDDAIMVPESIMNSPKILRKYEAAVKLMYEAYNESLESRKISSMDARYLLPKSSEQQYFMSMDWRTLIKIVNQRQDRAIQPKGDNLIAYGIIKELIKVYPKLKDLEIFNVDAPNKFYQMNARKERSTNLYLPEPQDDTFDWRLDDFVYPCSREELNGTDPEEKKSWFQIKLEDIRKLLKK